MPRKKTSARGNKHGSSRTSASLADDGELNSSSQSMSLNYELFNRSQTPDEFADLDQDSLWPIERIVSEEVDLYGTSIYQVQWENWERPDGTTTTWEKVLPGPNTMLRSWKGVQSRKRRQQASEGPEIDLDVINSFKPHNILTAEKACAYAEKLKLWPTIKFDDWDLELTTVNRDSVTRDTLHGARKRKRNNLEWTAARPASVNVGDEEPDTLKNVASSSTPSSSSENIWNIESVWNAAAITEGAATIRIINDIDDCSPVEPGFVYLESSREYMEGIPKPDPSFLAGCDCKDGCRNPLLCSCLMESQCIDEDDQPCPAYDKKGRFLFTNRREVVECNTNCTCRNCSNNVAQRPRRIPLELFKTHRHGWGVRPTVFVSSGTILGLFTGSVMTREALAKLDPEEKDYCFDLDTRDDDPEFKHAPKYSMSSHSAGNWTRFINHSCGPSARVYSVVIDTTLRSNMPFLAFVACQDIPPRKEITIDYNPRGHIIADIENNERKGKGKMNSDRTPCACGSEICRGFI